MNKFKIIKILKWLIKKAISKQADLSEDDIANLLAAKMLNSKQKNVIDYYNQGVSEMTGGSNQKIKLEPRLQKVLVISKY